MEILIKLMERYGIERIRLSNYCGSVVFNNGVLSYDHKYAPRYYTNEKFAYDVAEEELKEYASKIEFFLSNKGKLYESTMLHIDYDDTQYNHVVSRFTTYPSDILDSGVTIKNENIVVGNINQLRKFLSYTNNHNRYCRCCEKYVNEEVNTLLEVGGKFTGLFEKYDSFAEYYHNAIVD